jgi:hypothetical protein
MYPAVLLFCHCSGGFVIQLQSNSRRHGPLKLRSRSNTRPIALLLLLFAAALSAIVVSSAGLASADETKSPYPWAPAQTVQAGELASELAGKSSDPPPWFTLDSGRYLPAGTYLGCLFTEARQPS